MTTPKGELEVGLRKGWVQHLKLALSGAGGAAIVFGAFSLLQRQPDAGSGLLLSWGPWPVVVLVIFALAGPFLTGISRAIAASFDAVVTSVRQGADAHMKTAEALTKLAEQGSRQVLEVERLATFSAQNVPIMHERLDEQDRVLRQILAEVRREKDEERS